MIKSNVIVRNVEDRKEAERIARERNGEVEEDELNVGAYKVVRKVSGVSRTFVQKNLFSSD